MFKSPWLTLRPVVLDLKMEGVLLGVRSMLGLCALMPHSRKGEGVDPVGDGPP